MSGRRPVNSLLPWPDMCSLLGCDCPLQHGGRARYRGQGALLSVKLQARHWLLRHEADLLIRAVHVCR